jgi:hypothetical protein
MDSGTATHNSQVPFNLSNDPIAIPKQNEVGAVLILALVYIISISMVILALASWATNDLHNTASFNSASEIHYAVSSATNTAIESIRYAPMPSVLSSSQIQAAQTSSTLGNGNCWLPSSGLVSQLSIDNYTVAVWCNTTESLPNNPTRLVTLYACLSSLTTSSTAAAVTAAQTSCVAKPFLTATVTFDDYPSGGAVQLENQCNFGVNTCGAGQALTLWSWR